MTETPDLGFCVITTEDRDRLTKLVDLSGAEPRVEGYPSGATKFRLEERRFGSAPELLAGLLKITTNRKAAILRGAPAPHVNGQPVRKLYRADKGQPTIVAVLRCLAWLDFDFKTGPQPPESIWNDTEALVNWIVENLLPEEFRGVSFFWQIGPSHGIGGRLSVRLAFVLARPVTSAALLRWAATNIPAADPSCFHPSQFLYSAVPVVVGGPDPVAVRAGIFDGLRDTVEVEIPHVDERKVEAPDPRDETYLTGEKALAAQAAVLEKATRKEIKANRHGAMRAAAAYARGIGLSPADIKAAVRMVGAATGKPGWEREADELVRWAMALPQDVAALVAADPEAASTLPGIFTAAAELRGRKPLGPPFSTSLPGLDAKLRGGFRVGKLVVLVGPPKGGKTTTVAFWAISFMRAGGYVLILAKDEGPDGVVNRFGQMLGADGLALLDNEPAACQHAAALLDQFEDRHAFVDPYDPAATVESLGRLVEAHAKGRPVLVIVDSLQVVDAETARKGDGKRERTIEVINGLRSLAYDGALVFGLSQSNRNAWKDKKNASDPLSAGAETSSIEHSADILIWMPKPDDDENPDAIRTLSVEKARGLLKGKVQYRIDPKTAALTELDSASLRKDDEERRVEAARERTRTDAARVLVRLRKGKEPQSKSFIKDTLNISTARTDAAIAHLDDANLIEAVTGGRGGGCRWKVRPIEGRDERAAEAWLGLAPPEPNRGKK